MIRILDMWILPERNVWMPNVAQNVNAIGSKSDTPKPLHRKEKRSYFEEELLCFDAISEVNKKLRGACERDDSL